MSSMVTVLGRDVYDVSRIAELQAAHLQWVYHNFPVQLGEVTSADVAKIMGDGRGGADAIADAINRGDPRLVKRKHHGLLGALEELGELAHEFLKMEQGIRGRNTEWEAKAKDAVVDTIFFLISFCNTNRWDLEKMIVDTAEEVFARDWVRWPETGRPPEGKTADPDYQTEPSKGRVKATSSPGGPGKPWVPCGNPTCEKCGIEKEARQRIREAVARGWCAPSNSSKDMDHDLAEAIVEEVFKITKVMAFPADFSSILENILR